MINCSQAWKICFFGMSDPICYCLAQFRRLPRRRSSFPTRSAISLLSSCHDRQRVCQCDLWWLQPHNPTNKALSLDRRFPQNMAACPVEIHQPIAGADHLGGKGSVPTTGQQDQLLVICSRYRCDAYFPRTFQRRSNAHPGGQSPEAIRKILNCFGLPFRPPPLAPSVRIDDLDFHDLADAALRRGLSQSPDGELAAQKVFISVGCPFGILI